MESRDDITLLRATDLVGNVREPLTKFKGKPIMAMLRLKNRMWLEPFIASQRVVNAGFARIKIRPLFSFQKMLLNSASVWDKVVQRARKYGAVGIARITMMTARESKLWVSDGGAIMEVRDDLSLLNAIAHRRDAAAFNELCERYQKRAFSLALCMLRNAALAEDAVQDAMLSIWLSTRTAQIENAESWILSIVTNKSINVRLTQKRRAKREERMAMERRDAPDSDAVESNDLVAVLRSEIDKLPELECTLLASCYGASMSQRDIAKMVGLSQKTISNKIQKALEQLRANLGRAGVAAVIPLLTKDSILKAMTSGHDCPPGMTAKLMLRIDSAGSKAVHAVSGRFARTPRTTRPPRSPNTGIVVIGGLAIAGLAVVLIANAKFSAPPAPPVNSALPEIPPTPPSHQVSLPVDEPIFKEWNFADKAGLDGIKVLSKNWAWGQPFGRGAMSSGDGAPISLILPTDVRQRCVKISVACTTNAQTSSTAASWIDGRTVPHSKVWKSNAFHAENIYTSTMVHIFWRGSCLSMMGQGMLFGLTKFDKDWAGDRIVLRLTNVAVESVTLQSITEQEAANAFAKFEPELERLTKDNPEENPAQVAPEEALK